jgi:hypothetical protein
MNEQRKGRIMLLFLLGVFVFPIVVGLVLYLSDWRPGGKSHGELLRPSRPLSIQSIKTFKGQPFDASNWRGKWHLVAVASGSCPAECLKNLAMMRQIHASLGKEIDRLERVWVLDGALPPEVLTAVQAQYQDLAVLPNATVLARQFDDVGQGLYLVDPLGNLFMRYPPGSNPSGIRKDLMRLLTYSWTG